MSTTTNQESRSLLHKVISDAWGVGYPWACKVPGHEPGLVLTATPAMCVSCMSCISLQAECLTVQAAHLCFHTQAINEDFAIRLTANSQLFLKIELFSLSLSLQIQDHKIGIIMHTLMAYECTCCALNTASYMIRVVVDLRSFIDFVHKRSRSKVLRDTKPAAPGAMVHVRQPDSNGSEVIFCTTMQSGALQVDDFSATLSEIRNPKFLETSCLI